MNKRSSRLAQVANGEETLETTALPAYSGYALARIRSTRSPGIRLPAFLGVI